MPGSGPVSGRAVADIVGRILGRAIRVRAASPAMLWIVSWVVRDLRGFMQVVPEYVKPLRYDGSKIARLLGPVRATPYEDALATTVAWLQSARD